MHPAWNLDDLQPSVKTPARARNQSQMPPGLCAYRQAVPCDLKALEKVRADCGWIDEVFENNALVRVRPHESQQISFHHHVLCTGNSARSIFAEYLLKKIAPVRFETYSAGASPKPTPHPLALEILREDFKIDASDAYSKSWDEFKDVPFDFVITLCDNARETCPVWPGQPDSRALEASPLAGRPANKTPS
jgi:protein-tyrosine-phosphatase